MQAGKLRHVVAIQENQATQNEVGELEHNWVTIATGRASVEPISGREFFEAQQRQAEITHRVRMRYRTEPVPTMRILYDSRVLMIESVIDVGERRRELHLMCREMPNG